MSSEENQTRAKILDAAWSLLETNAGKGVRMSDIAKEAGLSRQAVYLHFPARAELLIATTRHIDVRKDAASRWAIARAAPTGVKRLNAFIEAWGRYIPEIYGVARALMALQETDEAARAAWANRMSALREGCAGVVTALYKDGALSDEHSEETATDLLWVLLSVRSWEQFTQDAGWTQQQYIERMKTAARQMLVK